MGKRPPYCLYTDVLRLLDALESDSTLTNSDKDLIRDAIDDVSSDLEFQTGHAYRLDRRGSPNAPETYESQGVSNTRPSAPLWASLDYRPVLPFDSAENDTLEVRTGKDSWTDVTDEEGSEFTIDHRQGRIKLYRRLIGRVFWSDDDDRFLRATYRYGALGGDQTEGGQTTLDGSLGGNTTDTSVSVANAARLPNSGTLLIYGDNVEYVDLESVDYGTNTLTVSREERATSVASHSDGDTIHYAPEAVRNAVAGAVAREMQEYDLWADLLVDTGTGEISAADRVEHWADRYDRLLQKSTEIRML